MELRKISPDLQELTNEEIFDINGGESIWYWLAYGVGVVAKGVVAFSKGASVTGFPPR